MIQSISDLVSLHPLLAGLPADMPDLIAGCATNVAFGPGRRMLVEGQRADTLYLIRRGRVALEVWQPGVGPLVIETLGPGSPLGWSWLFPPYRWHLDARALETVLAIAIDATCLREKAEADPAFGYALMQRISSVMLDRLQAARYRLLDLYGAKAQ